MTDKYTKKSYGKNVVEYNPLHSSNLPKADIARIPEQVKWLKKHGVKTAKERISFSSKIRKSMNVKGTSILPFVYVLRRKLRAAATKKKYPEFMETKTLKEMNNIPNYKFKDMLKR